MKTKQTTTRITETWNGATCEIEATVKVTCRDEWDIESDWETCEWVEARVLSGPVTREEILDCEPCDYLG